MEINITNGFYFNEYIKKIKNGVFVPFNESMIDGELIYPLFDNNFVNQRAIMHKTTNEDYNEKLNFFLKPDGIKKYDSITLWFGLDAFCQINMLTVLAYLEQINYCGKIHYQAIDDHTFETLYHKEEIILGEFTTVYKKLSRNQLSITKYEFLNKGLNDYLYIKSKDNRFYKYIKENLNNLEETQIIINILKDSKEFGLSDLYIKKMIDEVSLLKQPPSPSKLR